MQNNVRFYLKNVNYFRPLQRSKVDQLSYVRLKLLTVIGKYMSAKQITQVTSMSMIFVLFYIKTKTKHFIQTLLSELQRIRIKQKYEQLASVPFSLNLTKSQKN